MTDMCGLAGNTSWISWYGGRKTPYMELTLAHQAGTQVLVTCDSDPSHTFDLLTLVPGEQGLLNQSMIRLHMAKQCTRPYFHQHRQLVVS